MEILEQHEVADLSDAPAAMTIENQLNLLFSLRDDAVVAVTITEPSTHLQITLEFRRRIFINGCSPYEPWQIGLTIPNVNIFALPSSAGVSVIDAN